MPPKQPPEPGTAQYYAKVSPDDPLAGGLQQPSNFDFMLKNQPKPPSRFSGSFGWIPKPAKIILIALGPLLVLAVLYGVFFSGKTNDVDRIKSVIAYSHEISRISLAVQQGTKNTITKDLATTAEVVLSSQERELIKYLGERKIKIDQKSLILRQDKNTDSQLAAAAQNNNYDETYYSYLKSNLGSYQNELTLTYNGAGNKAKTILSADFDSVDSLLAAPQLQ